MSAAIPKFPKVTPSFHAVLKQRVNAYFEDNHIEHTGGWKLLSKGLVLFALTLASYLVLMLVDMNGWIAALICAVMGLLIASIGFNVMHDGSHGSFSKHVFVNKLAAFTLNVLGGSDFMWNQKHCIIHHAFTNVHDVDDDLDAGILMRMSEHQKHRKFHRLQHMYFWALYSLLYLFWIFYSDFKKYFTRKIGTVPLKKMGFRNHFVFWLSKLIWASIFVIIPIIVWGFVPWLVGFLVMTTVSGFVLSIVFQLAHTVEHTHFPVADETTNKMEDEWAVHQLKTTANFATNNRLISWYVGGLNFQVEHHLFPKLSHVHYPEIHKIVKQACKEYNVPYIEYRTMLGAVWSHISHLRRLGMAA